MTLAGNLPDPAGLPDAAGLEAGLWPAFAAAKTERAFLTAWLSILVSRVPQAALGVLFRADPAAGAFVPVAIVPDPRRDLAHLREIAERALASGRPATVADAGTGATRLAFPLAAAEGGTEGVVVLELKLADPRSAQAALREMHWAAGWLNARSWERRARDEGLRLGRAAIALDVLALAGEHRRPEAAAMAVVNELQTALACDQVSLGLLQGARTAPRIRLIAISYSAWFRRRSALAEVITAAMEECFDQAATVAAPPLPATARAIAIAHGALLAGGRTRHVLSVALPHRDGAVGVLTFERRQDRPFTEEERLVAESVAALLGPVMEQKRLARRWVGGRLADGALHVLGVLLGRRRLSWKLLALAVIALAVAAATVHQPFRLQADAVLRGEEQRAAVAPFAGYIATGALRAGDRVLAGQEIARLDDADLRLEELRWRSEMDRLSSQQRTALAQHDRAQVALLEAQVAQAKAQLDLTEAKLARTRILSPIDGIIVSGDLSQKLGAPVQVGDVLFEIAPLAEFRVDIYLDERDLRYAAVGQTGRLALTGQPSSGLPFAVTRITPMAEVHGALNSFRLEARLDAPGAGLRPGMEGVAKIDAGRALAAWVWTRRMVDWLRLTVWTWQP